MDTSRFEQARQQVLQFLSAPADAPVSIGLLGEKTVHAVVKRYLEPNPDRHELRVGRYVVDILCGQSITEVQTRSFGAMRKKLEFLLQSHPVTIACPIPCTKWLCWMQPQTGEVSTRRRSPKRGAPIDLCYELYWIRPFLTHPNLRLKILLIDMEEYRVLNGWSADGKRGSTRYDRLPLALAQELDLKGPGDYVQLLPRDLQFPFTCKDLQTAAHLSKTGASRALSVLREVRAITPAGRRGRAHLYSLADLEEPCPLAAPTQSKRGRQ